MFSGQPVSVAAGLRDVCERLKAARGSARALHELSKAGAFDPILSHLSNLETAASLQRFSAEAASAR